MTPWHPERTRQAARKEYRDTNVASFPIALGQAGFTLLELLVAMAIFAMLAVSGWQVFDNVSRSKERAEVQTQALTQLQYAYQQLQRDMSQVVAYNLPSVSDGQDRPISLGANAATQTIQQQNGFQLDNNVLSFIRYADPDPRYQEIPTLERIDYHFEEGNLIRSRYLDLGLDNSVPANISQILSDTEGGVIQVLSPQPSSRYPDESMSMPADAFNEVTNKTEDSSTPASNIQTSNIPKGVAITFATLLGTQTTPLIWTFALPSMPPVVTVPPSPNSDK